jgi:hypothetical protein
LTFIGFTILLVLGSWRNRCKPAAEPARRKASVPFQSLVGVGEERWGNFEAKRLGSLEINRQLEFRPADRCAHGHSFYRLRDAISHLFAERSVPCEHLTAEIPIERLIFGIEIAKSGCKLIKFSASSSIQFNK